MKHIVVAYGTNRVIGSAGELPWQGDMPADMRHFRDLTLGHSIIMGRKTFESIGRPLPNRWNIVVSRLGTVASESIILANSLDEAYDMADDDAYLIGGGQLYEQALDRNDIDIIHATEIMTDKPGDAFFPRLNEAEWTVASRQNFKADTQNAYDYSFIDYRAKK